MGLGFKTDLDSLLFFVSLYLSCYLIRVFIETVIELKKDKTAPDNSGKMLLSLLLSLSISLPFGLWMQFPYGEVLILASMIFIILYGLISLLYKVIDRN